MARSQTILCCIVLALALYTESTAATKGKGFPMIATETKCVDKCSTQCEPKETEVCKDVSVPFTVCKDVPSTETTQKCTKVCEEPKVETASKGKGKSMDKVMVKGKGKGKAPQKPWATIQRKGGKGSGRKKTLFTNLPEDQQQQIQEKWAARAAKEGREELDDTLFSGIVVWRCRSYGWIRPNSPQLLPAKVQESMATMTEELRGKAVEAETDLDRFAEDVLYFRICDRADITTQIDKDMEVNFKVYIDNKGAGAMEVEPA